MDFKFFILFLIAINLQVLAQPNLNSIKTGDLIFQDLDCGDLCAAIERVTPSNNGYKFSHMGLCIWKNDSLYVLESIGKGVCTTPYAQFINRSFDSLSKPKIKIARVIEKYNTVLKNAVDIALSYINTPYDDYYIMGDDRLYCSELFYRSFLRANNDNPFFELQPMTFKDPDSNTFFAAWEKYYKELDIPIPEGYLGCNPGGMSLSNKLIFYY